MTGQLKMGGRAIDRVSLGDAAAWPMVGVAAARAGLTVRDHRLHAAAGGAALRLRGEALLVTADAVGEDLLVMLGEMRQRVGGRIILLAGMVSTDQRILALSLGVDHVLHAPLDERELAAVLANAMREAHATQIRLREGERDLHWQIDGERWVLIAPNLREVRLTRAEYGVAQALLGNAGNVTPRAALVEAMNGSAGRGSGRTLDVLVSRLRSKVWDSARMELPLRSARNAGYLFAGQVAPLAVQAEPPAQT